MKSFLIKNLSIYFFFNCAIAILPIVLMPILTKYMTPKDYGLYAIYALMLMFFGIMSRFELNAALKREFVSVKDNFGQYVGTAFVFSLLMIIPSLLIVYVVSFYVKDLFGISFFWVFLSFPLVFLRGQVMNLHHLWQINSNSFLYGLWGLVSSVSMYSLSIFILVYFDIGWEARAVAEWLVSFLAFSMAVYFLKKHFNLCFVFKYCLLKKMLGYSFPLIPGALISYCITASDRFFLTEFSSSHELGLYSIALQLSFSLGLLFSAAYPVWESYVFNKVGCIDYIAFKRLSAVLVVVGVGGVLIVFCLAYVLYLAIPYLVASEFIGASDYVVPCLFVALAGGMYRLSNAVLVYMKKTKKVLSVSLMMLLVDIGLMYLFVGSYGAISVGYILAITFLIGAFLNMFFVYRYGCLSK